MNVIFTVVFRLFHIYDEFGIRNFFWKCQVLLFVLVHVAIMYKIVCRRAHGHYVCGHLTS